MRLKDSILLILLLLVGASSVFAQVKKIEFEDYTLDNGLRVILHQDKSTPIVAVSVMYHVGSKNERPDRTGFAHFFEHLLFEGSDNIGRGEYTSYVQDAGGTLNANTSSDRTYYYEILPSNQLEMGLWLESERMFHAKVEEKGIETQREVVKEERRQSYENQPYGTVLLEALSHSFTDHPYRWPTIGSMEHLEAAQEEDYKQFYKEFYVPNNAVLSIAGDIDATEAKKLIKKYFGTIPRGKKEIYRPNIVEKPLGKEVRDTIYDQIQLPAVILSYRTPAMGTDDYYAVQVLSTLLSGGQSARLYKALVDEQEKAVFVGNFPLPFEEPGIAITFGVANMGVQVQDLEAALDAEIARVQNEKVGDREFQKLMNQIESDIVSSNASVAGIAENLATNATYFNDPGRVNTEIERYRKVTPADLQRVAKKYYAKNNRAVLYYLSASEINP